MFTSRLFTSKSQSSTWRWAAAGALIGMLLATSVFAPARWLALAAWQASNGRVQLQDARGTIWSGSAQLTLSGGAGSQSATTLPSRLVWTLRPSWTHLSASFFSDCCTKQPLQLQIAPAWRAAQLSIELGGVTLPANLLTGLGAPWNTLQPAGMLELSSQGLQITLQPGSVVIAGQAQLKATDVSSSLSPLRPLGSYRVTLQGGTVPALELETLEGSLHLVGQGRWQGSRLQFSGTASAKPEQLPALSNLLNIIGQRSGAQSNFAMI